jgi:hypothetical protein
MKLKVPSRTETSPAQYVEDPVQTEVAAVLSSMPFRQPIVDEYNPLIHDLQPEQRPTDAQRLIAENKKATREHEKKVDTHWSALSEAARRAINTSVDVRAVMADFSIRPLDEKLPLEAASAVAEKDERTRRLLKRMDKTLGTVLEFDAVPDALLVPDIYNAPHLLRRSTELKRLTRDKRESPATFDTVVEHKARQVEQNPGITDAERSLVAHRYRYARDVKLLGLAAELHDQPLEAAAAHDGIVTHELQSGTKIVMTEEAFVAAPQLLNPMTWKSRHQIKDRVYAVDIGDQDYILKERKTPRHTDTKKGGHRDGLTSKEEFEVAREFAELGTITEGDVSLHWEKPLGYVEFPDGYQFCLFETDLQAKQVDISTLAREIEAVPESYEEEYDQVRQAAKKIYHERDDLVPAYYDQLAGKPKRLPLSRAARRYKKAYRDMPKASSDELTFEEFAKLKANYMFQQASDMLRTTIFSKERVNSDQDGYAVILGDGERPALKIIGFDFEYYQHSPDEARDIRFRRAQHARNGEAASNYQYNFVDRGVMLAASYAIMDRMGLSIPPKK